MIVLETYSRLAIFSRCRYRFFLLKQWIVVLLNKFWLNNSTICKINWNKVNVRIKILSNSNFKSWIDSDRDDNGSTWFGFDKNQYCTEYFFIKTKPKPNEIQQLKTKLESPIFSSIGIWTETQKIYRNYQNKYLKHKFINKSFVQKLK